MSCNVVQCRQRWLKCTRPGIKKGKWSDHEDKLLQKVMESHFHGWKYVAEKIPYRTSKQCRDRWNNYVSPAINKNPFSIKDDKLLKRIFAIYGNQWAKLAQVSFIYLFVYSFVYLFIYMIVV